MQPYIDYEERLIWWTKWTSTFTAVGCAVCSSLDWYPINVWLGFLAGVGWSWVGWKWNEWSLITINALLTVVYGVGVIRSLFL
jgi:hypothetical protein